MGGPTPAVRTPSPSTLTACRTWTTTTTGHLLLLELSTKVREVSPCTENAFFVSAKSAIRHFQESEVPSGGLFLAL